MSVVGIDSLTLPPLALFPGAVQDVKADVGYGGWFGSLSPGYLPEPTLGFILAGLLVCLTDADGTPNQSNFLDREFS